ncbi:MAG: (2Fe-2S) ferredoxin domain-containing protein [Syntrophales bacterium]|jgi:(2Fe-2S) ferredoxin|nr:(2Fe-2S) ferredoxin domain-containing protein [Syntrophales bacterium]MCK9527230.1 (2Fe-2S) ferredoxin domain-containing protein [Syntrophales bacterium]MDX9921300.1 (2Fe-2S) ferredoxin domain-containing protein [Syntrophales bacterium]
MSGEELLKIKEAYIQEKRDEARNGVIHILVHMGTCGIAAGARDIFDILNSEIDRMGLTHIRLRSTGCAGLCSREPMMTVEIPGRPPVVYGDLDRDKTKEILVQHVLGGRPITGYAIRAGFEGHQTRVNDIV